MSESLCELKKSGGSGEVLKPNTWFEMSFNSNAHRTPSTLNTYTDGTVISTTSGYYGWTGVFGVKGKSTLSEAASNWNLHVVGIKNDGSITDLGVTNNPINISGYDVVVCLACAAQSVGNLQITIS